MQTIIINLIDTLSRQRFHEYPATAFIILTEIEPWRQSVRFESTSGHLAA